MAGADHVYTPTELKERALELKCDETVIEGLVPKQQLSLVVGESGLGKSPLLYQAAICVAAGVPFLERPVRQGRVLWMDCENGLGQVDGMLDKISKFLGLPQAPADLLLWNLNDAGEDFGAPGHQFEDIVRRHDPDWVLIDTLKTMFVGVESKNETAAECYRFLRKLMSEVQCSITGVHHPRKKGELRELESLETTSDPRGWFDEASGAKSLITNCDVRLGIDKPVSRNSDLAIRGFERVTGEIPLILVSRVLDEQSESPVGYRLVTGADAVTNPEHRRLWDVLPPEFRFKDAKEAYGKGDQATLNALNKLMSAGILRKREDGRYEKTVELNLPPLASEFDGINLNRLVA